MADVLSFVWSTVLPIAGPLLIFQVLPWILQRRNRKQINLKAPLSPLDEQLRLVLTFLLVVYSLSQFAQIATSTPKTVYDTLQVSPTVSNFELKRALAEASKRIPSHNLGKISDLVTRLCSSKTTQRIYDTYGEEGFNCNFCASDTDYKIFVAADAFQAFSIFCLFAGMATSRWDTDYLRWWILGAGVIWVGLETFDMASSLNVFEYAQQFTLLQLNFILRRLIFGTLAILPIFLARPYPLTDQQLLIGLVSQSVAYNERLDRLLESRRASAKP